MLVLLKFCNTGWPLTCNTLSGYMLSGTLAIYMVLLETYNERQGLEAFPRLNDPPEIGTKFPVHPNSP